jgi:twitching motility protein PilT
MNNNLEIDPPAELHPQYYGELDHADPSKVPTLIRILDFAGEMGASDIHLCSGAPPMMRLHGDLVRISEFAEGFGDDFTPSKISEVIEGIMNSQVSQEFKNKAEVDFSINLTTGDRVRVNLFRNIYGIGAVFRIVPSKIPDFDTLGIPPVMKNVVMKGKGLILVTGPTGSGKSTTLAALIDYINRSLPMHIITIEDPVEFVHTPRRCLINQREVGKSANTFMEALRGALREDPDVILVGEMRDLETVSMAITAAETGHLVFGTLHTISASKTVDRMISEFPADRQNQVRAQLAESLTAVISQALIPRKDRPGRVAAFEVLISTPAVHNLIRENKTYQINTVIQTGTHLGMIGLDQSLMSLVNHGTIEAAEARRWATEPRMFPDRPHPARQQTAASQTATHPQKEAPPV